MRRADRLFQIVQLLRTRKRLTALQIADSLEVSERTIYRDVQDLSLSGVPIISETGVGYTLDKAYNLPPITFSEGELESMLLGARMVQAWTDREMAAEATRAIERIESILPGHLKPLLQSTEILVPAFHIFSDVSEKMPWIRQAIKESKKINLSYQRADGEYSNRKIWPLGLFFWGNVWTLVAWCELRNGFRQFRLDRMEWIKVQSELFEARSDQTLKYFLITECDQD
jgi:predicted DNA-binding transcriptional regulator YafY